MLGAIKCMAIPPVNILAGGILREWSALPRESARVVFSQERHTSGLLYQSFVNGLAQLCRNMSSIPR